MAKDYGKSKTYTPKQIIRTIERYGLSVANSCFGIAMFSDREAFDQYYQEIGEAYNYSRIRSEIADKHFNGNSNFSITGIAPISSDYGGGLNTGCFDFGGDDGGGGE